MVTITVFALVIVVVVFPVLRLPTPTGPDQIGTRTYQWVDASRPEPFLAKDLQFVLNRLEDLDNDDVLLSGHLNPGRAVVFGMSLGGYVGPEACRVDARFRACLAVDAGKTAAVAEWTSR